MTTYYNYDDQTMPVSANPTSSVNGNDPQGGETWYAPAGPSSVSGDGGGDTLVGSDGDNIFYITNPNDIIDVANGQSGIKTAVAYTWYELPANVQNLDDYNDFNYAVGNSLSNLIIVSGRQWVDGEGGNDVMVGGSGDATFVEQVGVAGNDVIYNWHSGDQIQFLGASFTSFSQIQSAMTQQGSDVLLDYGNNESVTFRNTAISDFDSSSFLMPLNTSLLGKMTFNQNFSTLDLYNPTTNTGVWQTNFGGNLQNAWAYQLVSNGETEAYVAPGFVGNGQTPLGIDPFSIDNGVLTITAAPLTQQQSQAAYGAQYSSGMLNTIGTFAQKYGYFEMDAKLSNAVGSWPAFWMEPNPWAPDQEADIMESLGLTPMIDYVRADGGNQSLYDDTLKLNPSGWNTYGMLWTPTTVTFYLNNVAVLTGPTPSTWDQPLSMILNLAIGGWGGTPDSSEFPTTMQVQWVRAYALADGSSVVVHSTPEPPAGTIREHGSPIATTSSSAEITEPNLGGKPLSDYPVYFDQSQPSNGDLAPGTSLYVWENSGAVFAAESNGSKLGHQTTLVAGSVNQFVAGAFLGTGDVALVYTEDDSGTNNVWTIVLDPKTGTMFKQEIGPGSGDDVHIVPISQGDFAVSWDTGSGVIDSVVYDAHAYSDDGWIGPTTTLTGDLIGENKQGSLVASISGNSSDDQLYTINREADTPPPLITLSPTTLTETASQSGETAYTFTLTRSYNTSGTATVDWMVQGDGAQPAAAQDFQNDAYPTGTVSFAAGQTTATVTVEVNGADVVNGDTFTFTLTQATGADLGAAVSDATIDTSSGSDVSMGAGASHSAVPGLPDAGAIDHFPGLIMVWADWLLHA